MKITIDISDSQWEVLKPVLEPMLVNIDCKDDDEKINRDEILSLECGRRILNILQDGFWQSDKSILYRYSSGNPAYGIVTVPELKSITRQEFMKHNNAGKKSWNILKAYIETL